MPFIALVKNGSGDMTRVDITTLKNPRMELAYGEPVCQLCKSPMIIKAGQIVRPHFAHKVEECTSSYERDDDYSPESTEHRIAKMVIANTLRSSYGNKATVEYEVPIPEIKRIADVMLTTDNGWRLAYEIQFSPISVQELDRRSNDYLHAGVDSTWAFGGKADNNVSRDWSMFNSGYYLTFSDDAIEEYKTLSSGDEHVTNGMHGFRWRASK